MFSILFIFNRTLCKQTVEYLWRLSWSSSDATDFPLFVLFDYVPQKGHQAVIGLIKLQMCSLNAYGVNIHVKSLGASSKSFKGYLRFVSDVA